MRYRQKKPNHKAYFISVGSILLGIFLVGVVLGNYFQ